jgi:hypothetical protein
VASTTTPVQNSNTVTHSWAVIATPTLFLTPSTATNPVNGRDTLTVKALDGAGSPINGLSVQVRVTAGPNSTVSLTGATNSSGIATVFYSSTVTGTDTLRANATITGNPVTSNTVTSTWSGLLCDVDNNGKIDNRDISAILSARNTPVQPGDVRDADFDGVITIQDGRACTAKCTKAGCAQ